MQAGLDMNIDEGVQCHMTLASSRAYTCTYLCGRWGEGVMH